MTLPSAGVPTYPDANYWKAECEKARQEIQKLCQQQADADAEREAAVSAIEASNPDAARFRFLVADPETARHLLSLLQQGKGNEDSLRRMIDRIAASKAAPPDRSTKPE